MKLLDYNNFKLKTEELFNLLLQEVSEVLPNARIEHIGSSSIPNSLSKGDLDVFVGVSSDVHEEAVKIIKSIGFSEKQGTFRSNELCMLTTDKFNYDVAIQVVVNGSKFEDFIQFRDLLLADKKLVQIYNQIKERNCQKDHYRIEKSKFITNLLGLNNELHNFVVETEEQIQACFSENLSSKMSNPHWTMWIDIEVYSLQKSELNLIEVKSLSDWDEMLRIRLEIEESFGVTKFKDVKQMVADIKSITNSMDSRWYLVKIKDKVIGEFGIVDFKRNDKKIGRIQDVDILPTLQGCGYGNLLFKEILNIAKKNNYDSVCLMAETSDWPKYWYLKNGFKKVGST